MFQNIMVPVDLAHAGDLGRALQCAGEMARQYGAKVTYVGVTTTVPSALGRNPQEYQARLETFAGEQAKAHGIETAAHTAISHDPTIDVDDVLLKATHDLDPDLVVMESQVPNLTNYIWPSNGGKIAAHATCSVMVVRG